MISIKRFLSAFLLLFVSSPLGKAEEHSIGSKDQLACGQIAAYVFLKACNVKLSDSDKARMRETNLGDFLSLKRYLESYALSVSAEKLAASELASMPTPSIAQLEIFSGKSKASHFVAVLSVKKGSVMVVDPTLDARDPVSISLEDFARVFTGNVIHLTR